MVLRIAAVVLVIAALALSALRFYLLPEIAVHRTELENRIGRLIDETVEIGAISAGMRGLHPELLLHDFRILDQSGRTGIRFERVVVGIDLPRTLLSGQLVPHAVVIYGTRVSVRRRGDGSIVVLGLNVIDHPPYWLLGAERVELLDSAMDWQDELRGSPPVELGHADLRLANQGGRHLLSADVGLGASQQTSLVVRADLRGDLFGSGQWGGRIYLSTEALDAHQLHALLPFDPGLVGGSYAFRVWSDWTHGDLARLAGRVSATQAVLRVPDSAASPDTLRFEDLATWFRWRGSETNWLMEFDELRWKTATGSRSLPARITVGMEFGDKGQTRVWRLMGNRLRFGDLLPLAVALLPPDSHWVGDGLRGLSAGGMLRDFAVVYRSGEDGRPRLLVCGDFFGVGFEPRDSVPGISRLRGHVCGTELQGVLRVGSGKSDLALPQLMRTPARLDRLSVGARWHRDGAARRIRIEDFGVAATQLDVRGRGTVIWPDDPRLPATASLNLSLAEMPAEAIKLYLPDAAYPDWSRTVREVLQGGRLVRGQASFRGVVEDLPSAVARGSVEAALEFLKLDLRYDPDWPPLQRIDGTLRLAQSRLDWEAAQGSIGRGEITKFGAHIPDLLKNPRLTIDGSVRASFADVVDFLAHTPKNFLAERLMRLGEPRGGSAEVALALDIPFESATDTLRLAGSARLKDLVLGGSRVAEFLGPLSGDVSFSEAGLKESRLRGTLLGDPLSLELRNAGADTALSARSRIHVANLAKAMPSTLWERATGDAEFQFASLLAADSSSAQQPLAWTIRSDLRGLAINLPAPAGKSAESERELVIQGQLEPEHAWLVRVGYGHQLNAEFRGSVSATGSILERGTVVWDREMPGGPPAPGLRLFGRLSDVDMKDWSEFVSSAMDGAGQPDTTWQQVDLETNAAMWKGRKLGALKLQAARNASGWKGSVGGDLATGQFDWEAGVDASPRLRLELDRLSIPNTGDDLPDGASADRISPRAWPSVRADVRRILWKGVDVGSLHIDAERVAQGLRVRQVELAADHHRMSVSGDWLDPSGPGRVRVEGQASADSLGDLAGRLGAGNIKGTRTSVDFKLSWPGVPWKLDRAALDGDLKLEMEQGTLRDVEPGWGRVIGFLNIGSIWRRINLDFRDLFSDGFAYDGIKGRWQIESGTATTNGFAIDGMAARIVIDGKADLRSGTLDQIVTVVPRTSVALPIAGTLAGGPAVGAAVLVAQGLVGEQVDSLTATRYHVTGPWEAPRFDRVEGNMPMELLGRAWSGLKGLSGREKEQEQTKK